MRNRALKTLAARIIARISVFEEHALVSVSISRRGLRDIATQLVCIAVVVASVACHDLTATRQLPDGVESPSMYNNREGAVRLTLATTVKLRDAIKIYLIQSGLLTDELTAVGGGLSDPRITMANVAYSQNIYLALHEVRSLAHLARGVLAKYVVDASTAWQGMLLVYEAYAEILLADGWCSGVPLSTMDFEKDWTFRPGSSTTAVYEHAILLLDSAYTLSADSLQVQSAARILKARALLALGRYADARVVVQSVETSDQFPVRISFQGYGGTGAHQYAELFTLTATIADAEGINGLPYLSSRDPRTSGDSVRIAASGVMPSRIVWFPRKYIAPDSTWFVFTSGVEARLIDAEASLQQGDWHAWLTALNTLRTTGAYVRVDTIRNSGGIERIDTAWVAGSGGVAGLGPLNDPGSLEARITLLFAERAAWLFVTGSRQGDLRRLVRNYDRDKETVYPTGEYRGVADAGVYGPDITFGIPGEEYRNPLFKGCLSDE